MIPLLIPSSSPRSPRQLAQFRRSISPLSKETGSSCCHPTNIKRLHKCFSFLALAFTLLLLSLTIYNSEPPSQEPEPTANADNVPLYDDSLPCEFEDLAQSFINPRQSLNEKRTAKHKCWKLQNEVIQVPTTAIINRNHLTKLGQGKAGAVFKALVQLQHTPRVCYCALKTDLCQESLWFKKEDSVSCVKDGSYLMKGFSFLMGEFTGMLVQYSFYRRGLEPPPGIMPNWAVVKAKSSKLGWWVPSFWGYRAKDSTIVGILMPLRKFQGIYDLSRTDVPFPDKLPDIAEMMLPAARGLETMHGLGLVHQDMHSGNVVIADDTGLSMLADLGLVSKRHECTSDMCDYCVDASIGDRRFSHKAIEGLNAMESDANRFAELIVKYFFRGKQGYTEQKEEMLACTEAWQVVRLLERWHKDADLQVPDAS